MRADLALVDQALFRFVHELDRVFDGQDVAVFAFVLVVDHGRQRGRFAGAGRTGHQHQAARLVGQLLEDLRRAELLERKDLRGNGPHHRRRAAVLDEGIDPEAGQVGDGEGKVALEVFLVGLALPVVHDVIDHGMHVLVLHGRQVDAPDVAMDANHRRQAG